jgi:hypothetical protein
LQKEYLMYHSESKDSSGAIVIILCFMGTYEKWHSCVRRNAITTSDCWTSVCVGVIH